MKIHQKKGPFEPIEIVLESREEAEALQGMVNKIVDCYASEDREITPDRITKGELRLAASISNAFFDRKVST